jgi:diadenylate cyclase
MLDSLLEVGWADIADVVVVGLLLWALMAWARRVHAGLALLGLAFLGGFYLVALQLELQLTAWFFQGFFAVLVVLLVVVFQDDLRRLFEQIAVLGLRRRPARTPIDGVTTLVHSLLQLADRHTGALLVLPGREPLERHLQGGTALDAVISEALLLSIFDPGSPGHDGAVLVQGDRLVRFAVHLPLSEDRTQLGPGGTRHAAALGLAERCDALCVVVSEERGTVAIATRGRLQILEKPEQLMDAVRQHLAHLGTGAGVRRTQWQRLWRRGLEVVAAFALALSGWWAFVPGSTVDQVSRAVLVEVRNMPEGYVLEGVEPKAVEVKVEGPRRELLLAQAADFQLSIDASLVKLGRRTFAVSDTAVRHSTGLEVLDVRPEKVRLSVRESP